MKLLKLLVEDQKKRLSIKSKIKMAYPLKFLKTFELEKALDLELD